MARIIAGLKRATACTNAGGGPSLFIRLDNILILITSCEKIASGQESLSRKASRCKCVCVCVFLSSDTVGGCVCLCVLGLQMVFPV